MVAYIDGFCAWGLNKLAYRVDLINMNSTRNAQKIHWYHNNLVIANYCSEKCCEFTKKSVKEQERIYV